MGLSEKSFYAAFYGRFGLRRRQQFFQQPEINVNGHVALAHQNGSLDGGCQQGNFGSKREAQGITVPHSLLIRDLNRHSADGAEKVLKGAVDNALDLFFRFAVSYRNVHDAILAR